MLFFKTYIFIIIFFPFVVNAQIDSSANSFIKVSKKFTKQLDSKIEKYQSRITNKTKKTLIKLAKLENKIKGLLEKVNPEIAKELFSDGKITFAFMLQKLQDGNGIVANYKNTYNRYIDEVSLKVKYLQQQKEYIDRNVLKKLENNQSALKVLSEQEDRKDIILKLIKDRKKELLEKAFKVLGNNKFFTKINKETFYCVETLKNYKAIFDDPQKAEKLVKSLLNNVPAFQQFIKENSQLASLFGNASINEYNAASLVGLQTRASVQSDMQQRLSAAGTNAQSLFSQNMQNAQAQLNKIKSELGDKLKGNFGNEGNSIANKSFKPNMQKTKTFAQRIEYSTNLQFGKSNNLLPTTADIGLSIGYKLNDKSVIGIGSSYKLGLGSIQQIKLSNQGLSIRSFLDWKIKKQFFICGGYEMNLVPSVVNTTSVITSSGSKKWQQSSLLGVSKKVIIKAKYFKTTQLKLLYDFLYRQHSPVSQPIIFRVGYNF